MSNFLDKTFKKFKSIKHIEIIVAVLFGVILLILYLSTFGKGNAYQSSSSSSLMSTYSAEVEAKLSDVLSEIDGVGKVRVMVMLDEGVDLNSEVVPRVSSVIVVAGGAKDYRVKLELYKAVETILKLPTENIEILVGN